MTSARAIVSALEGKWRGSRGMCCCPAHEDRSPSLSVGMTRDGRPLVHCFTGCSQVAVIDALRSRGLWEGDAKVDPSYPGYLTRPHDGHSSDDERQRQEKARTLWDRANPIRGTPVESYLAARSIRTDTTALRYLPNLTHSPSGKSFPCMIAALTDFQGKVTAVQRTWIARDGQGKAPVESPKMTLGPMGRAAVKLFDAGKTLGLAEGIETALSSEALYCIPTWATLSANRLKAIRIPPTVEMVVIFGDRGKVGQEEACEAADYYERCGFKVDVYFPDQSLSDFNDALKARA
jgi:putative DNA primase/helicase